MNLNWNSPDKTPEVEIGTEEEFWIAVDSRYSGKTHVFLAYYQNRPLDLDEDGYPIDEDVCLYDTNSEPIASVRWTHLKEHECYENYYTPIEFSEDYVLLGWAEYQEPKFTGISA